MSETSFGPGEARPGPFGARKTSPVPLAAFQVSHSPTFGLISWPMRPCHWMVFWRCIEPGRGGASPSLGNLRDL